MERDPFLITPLHRHESVGNLCSLDSRFLILNLINEMYIDILSRYFIFNDN